MSNKTINAILDSFDFNKVKKAIDFFEMQGNFGDPCSDVSIKDLKEIAKKLLEDVYNLPDCPIFTWEFAGFEATRKIMKDTKYKKLELSYVLATTFKVSDEDPFKESQSPFKNVVERIQC